MLLASFAALVVLGAVAGGSKGVTTPTTVTVTNTETATQTVTVAPNHQFGPNGFGNRNGG